MFQLRVGRLKEYLFKYSFHLKSLEQWNLIEFTIEFIEELSDKK